MLGLDPGAWADGPDFWGCLSYLSSEVRNEEEWEPPFSVARPGMFTLPETRDVERKSRSQKDVSFDLES